MSNKNAIVYWLFDGACTTPEVSGYVGITRRLIKERMWEHCKEGRFSDFGMRVLFSVPIRPELWVEPAPTSPARKPSQHISGRAWRLLALLINWARKTSARFAGASSSCSRRRTKHSAIARICLPAPCKHSRWQDRR